jgi:hypothetical protein
LPAEDPIRSYPLIEEGQALFVDLGLGERD